ncbi:hypothetical protein TNCV_3875271 [Trichonephila clavipes]|uniref:Transposase n=1 Tax=Trichonephila clavipes TaxID=2585209 RepID=A0A8X6SRU5_TRICX|nr:hypothetical protein TNCV_3875271 [Trichonephila clavipes]
MESLGNNALPYHILARWIEKFQQGRVSTSDEQRSGRPEIDALEDDGKLPQRVNGDMVKKYQMFGRAFCRWSGLGGPDNYCKVRARGVLMRLRAVGKLLCLSMREDEGLVVNPPLGFKRIITEKEGESRREMIVLKKERNFEKEKGTIWESRFLPPEDVVASDKNEKAFLFASRFGETPTTKRSVFTAI